MIRLHYQKRLFLDDLFLLIAVLCLCGSMIILLRFCTLLYQIESYIKSDSLSSPTPEMLEHAQQYHIVASIYHSFAWTTICVVKWSFLLFFRKLLLRVHAMMSYWRIVLGITVMVWLWGGLSAVIFCFDLNYNRGKSDIVNTSLRIHD